METLGVGGLLVVMGGIAVVFAVLGCVGDFIYRRVNK